MPFYKNGPISLYFEEAGSGYPLLCLPGGGLNASIASFSTSRPYSPIAPFNPMEEFSNAYRCIAMDLRNSKHGQSSGPLEIERPWDAYTDDQLRLMDHLGIERFLVLGLCVSGPMIWNLLKRAPDRIDAAVIVQPSGFRAEQPNLFFQNNMKAWGPPLCERQPNITMNMVEAFLTKMYLDTADFVFTVDRNFVRSCQTPILVLPDDIPAHPFDVAMESAELAPNAQVSLYPWKEPKSRIPMAVRHVRTFLKAYRPEADGW